MKKLLIACLILILAQAANAQEPITPDNVADLEFGYALPGFCGAITPDDQLMAVAGSGVYDLSTGEQQFPIGRGKHAISPDGQYLAVMNEGVYAIATGEMLFPIAGTDDQYHDDPTFSHDSQYLGVVGDYLYRLPSGEKILPIYNREREAIEFSPDNTLVALTGQGVFETATGERLFIIGGFTFGEEDLLFSPDGRYLAVTIDGVYHVETGERLVEMSAGASFSADSQWVAVGLNGVFQLDPFEQIMSLPDQYHIVFDPTGTRLITEHQNMNEAGMQHVVDIASGTELFSLPNYGSPYFTPDGQWMIAEYGIYRAEDGALLYDDDIFFDDLILFNPEGTLMANYLGIFDFTRQEYVYEDFYGQQTLSFSPAGTLIVSAIHTSRSYRCALYAVAGRDWGLQHGVVYPKRSIMVRDVPNGYAFTSTSTVLIVDAYHTLYDNDWYRVGEDAWVDSRDVDVIIMPDTLEFIP